MRKIIIILMFPVISSFLMLSCKGLTKKIEKNLHTQKNILKEKREILQILESEYGYIGGIFQLEKIRKEDNYSHNKKNNIDKTK